MTKSILIETYTPEVTRFVSESIEDPVTKKRMWYLQGICMQAEVKNRNQRTYPINEIQNAVQTLQTDIANQQCYGELDHPLDSRVSVELKNVSHLFESLQMQGNDAVGRIKILETPMGCIASKILEGGGRLGVSTRGTGEVTEGGGVRGFMCRCIDLVATPSAPNAMPTSIYESLQQDIQSRRVMSLAEAMQEDKSAQRYFELEVKKFVESLLKR